MLTINGITVRLGGRTILDRATATVPPGSRVGLIGRNGAGKSTLMKAMIGQIDPDEGEIEMPRRTRLGYIAQEAPSGTATPFETVLAADTERAQLMDEAEHCTDPHRLGDGLGQRLRMAGWRLSGLERSHRQHESCNAHASSIGTSDRSPSPSVGALNRPRADR